MKKVSVLTILALVWFAGSAMALDPGGCNHPFWFDENGNPVPGMEEWQCLGKLELTDIGYNFEGPEAEALLDWDMSGSVAANPPFPGNFIFGGGTFEIRRFPAGVRDPYVRYRTKIGQEDFVPVYWKAQRVSGVQNPVCDPGVPCPCPDGQVSYFMNAVSPPGCVCDESNNWCADIDPSDTSEPCNQPWGPEMEAVFTPLPIEEVDQILWVDKGATAFKEQRESDATIPKYKLYPMNFWDYDNAWKEIYYDFNGHFPPNILPEANSIQTIQFTMTDGTVHTREFSITETTPMPTVSATKLTEDGLKMTIRAKEIKTGLKITWDDPKFKEIMRPGIQLRVYVGAYDRTASEYMSQDIPQSHETFMWIDCPAQLHKMLITSEHWNALKSELLAAGYTEATIMIVYRTIEYDENLGTEYMNRGHSELITVLLN